MNSHQKAIIKEKIAKEKPEHLGGFEKNWLFIKEIDMRFGKVIQVFSINNGQKEIVTTIVC